MRKLTHYMPLYIWGVVIGDGILSILIALLNAYVLQWVTNATNDPNNAMYWLMLVIGECIGITLIEALEVYWGKISKHALYTELVNRFTDQVIYSDYEFHEKHSPGEISSVSHTMFDVAKIPSTALSMLRSLCMIVVNGYFLYRASIPVGIASTFMYGILMVISMKGIKKWDALDMEFDNIKTTRNNLLDDVVNGFELMQSTSSAPSYYRNKIVGYTNFNLGVLKKRTLVDATITVWSDSISGLVTIGILVFSLYQLQLGTMNSSYAVALIVYVWRIVNPIVWLTADLSEVSYLRAQVNRFNNLMAWKNRVIDGDIQLKEFNSDITFKNVSFEYEDSNNVIRNLDLVIHKGEHVGICGPTGGGKSTLLKLIPRFYDVSEGSISIDGMDVKMLTQKSIRQHMGIVNQDPFIFDATLRDNICYGEDPGTHSDEEIYEACRQAYLYDFVRKLKDGLDTKVGPRGMKLSGGQKQRIALTRIFLRNPDIILLDEATSALDNETESYIQEAMQMFSDKTMIVVAHRLSTIKDSDKIVVLDNHQIVEQGTHEELVQLNGVYAGILR